MYIASPVADSTIVGQPGITDRYAHTHTAGGVVGADSDGRSALLEKLSMPTVGGLPSSKWAREHRQAAGLQYVRQLASMVVTVALPSTRPARTPLRPEIGCRDRGVSSRR